VLTIESFLEHICGYIVHRVYEKVSQKLFCYNFKTVHKFPSNLAHSYCEVYFC